LIPISDYFLYFFKMKISISYLLVILSIPFSVFGQSYTSFFTGNTADTTTQSEGGICLMGGATENDEAMKWFLKRSGHGDVLVLRASGGDGYNDYLYNDLGVDVNSVETIVFNNPGASEEDYIHQKIKHAEAIWFAGGDQSDYVTYWRHTSIDSLINDAIVNRHVVIGGTSAGMAIMGGFYYSAMHESVTSAEALADPYNSNITVDSARFIHNRFLEHVITDTHYDGRDRMGRHVTFMARIFTDWGIEPKGIACEEYAAVCIDTTGLAMCFGRGPREQDFTYFLQPNCELADREPESCIAGSPLDWNRSNKALKVYKINGTANGENIFNLNDWESGTGGVWEDWYVNKGTLVKENGNPINCGQVTQVSSVFNNMKIYPNPANGGSVSFNNPDNEINSISIIDLFGKIIKRIPGYSKHEVIADVAALTRGVYLVIVETQYDTMYYKVVLE
jgi:cyanophycinase-like exopeptidase